MSEGFLTLVISYDIADARCRRRIERVLKQHGVRVLESVFECQVAPAKLEQLKGKLSRQINCPGDGIRIYRLCADCRQPAAVLGAMFETPPGSFVVV